MSLNQHNDNDENFELEWIPMFRGAHSCWSVVKLRTAGKLAWVREAVLRRATANLSHAMI